MFVIIVGGGKTGSQLAEQLLSQGHKVRLIEDRPAVLERLKQELPPEIIVSGDGSSPVVLEAAGVKTAQVLAAVTGEDEANLVITTFDENFATADVEFLRDGDPVGRNAVADDQECLAVD